MPTPITQAGYWLERTTPYQMDVNITDATPYFAYQVYVDNAFQITRMATEFVAQIRPNQKVDILGCAEDELNTNFASTLSDANGDKVEFFLDGQELGDELWIFWDNGTGTIDYAEPLDIIDTSSLPIIMAYDDFLGLDTPNFLILTTPHFLVYQTLDVYGSIRIIITPRILTGTYQFAIEARSLGGASPAFPATVYINTTPNEISPDIVSYDPTSDTLMLDANSTDSSFYYVYAGAWNGDQGTVNLTTPYQMSMTSTITIDGLRGSVQNGTIYLLVREQQNGLQDSNWNFIAFQVIDGNWIENIPDTPTDLTVTVTYPNMAFLQWSNPGSRFATAPEGFYIYDGDPVNFSTPSYTLVGGNKTGYNLTIGPIEDITQFSIKAYKGSVLSAPSNTVLFVPYSIPGEPFGSLETTWLDS